MSDDNSDEETKPLGKRPNAKYSLSNPDSSVKEQEGLTFYYNRERRLENAPDLVKNLYKNESKGRMGLFRTLTADRPRKFLFFIIVFMCLGILSLSIFGFFDKAHILDGNKIDISATSFEGTTYTVLKKTAGNSNAYTGAVEIVISAAVQPEEIIPPFYHKIFFTLEKDEFYRFPVPFESPELRIELHTERDTINFTFKAE